MIVIKLSKKNPPLGCEEGKVMGTIPASRATIGWFKNSSGFMNYTHLTMRITAVGGQAG